MSNIQKVLTSRFGNLKINVLKTEQHEPGITRRQLGEMLEYSDPQNAIDVIHRRNQGRLDPLSVPVKLTGTDGKAYDTRVYGFKGVLEVCRYSQQPNANAVMDWAWETLDKLRKGDLSGAFAVERARQDEQIDQLLDEVHLLRQQVAGLRNGHGSFQLWDVAQHLRKNGIGNGNTHKALQMLIENGLLQKDVSVKKRGLYRPFLKDIRAGYFDHELTNNGQPMPVWLAEITVTAKGMNWIVHTLLSVRNRKWERERPMIHYSREAQRRIAGLSPEVGGAVLVNDPCGSRVVWVD